MVELLVFGLDRCFLVEGFFALLHLEWVLDFLFDGLDIAADADGFIAQFDFPFDEVIFILDVAAATLVFAMRLGADAVAAAVFEPTKVGIDERSSAAAAAISLIRLGLTLTLLEGVCCIDRGAAAATFWGATIFKISLDPNAFDIEVTHSAFLAAHVGLWYHGADGFRMDAIRTRLSISLATSFSSLTVN